MKRHFIKPSKFVFNRRCNECGGFGHGNEQCTTSSPVCHICGATDHYKANCPLKRKYIRAVKLNLPDDENLSESEASKQDSTADDDSSSESDSDTSETSGSSSDFDDIGLLNIKTLKVSSINTTTKEDRENTTLSSCDCRFKDKCVKALIDSGCTSHVTGKRTHLKNIRETSPVELENAFGKRVISTTRGDLPLMLPNNTVLQVTNVTYSPFIHDTLLSTKQLADQGISTSITEKV